MSSIPLNEVDDPSQEYRPSFRDLTQILLQIKGNKVITSGVSCFQCQFKILMTRLMRLCLMEQTSISISSILKVIEDIISLATVQFGAIHPLRIQTIFRTFSTKKCGLIQFLSSIICALVSLLIECSVIFTAQINSSSIIT